MKWNDHLLLWNHAAVSIMDIRYTVMMAGEAQHGYRLPSSGFLYAIKGAARIGMDGSLHEARRFHVLHGGKGTYLDILAEEDGFHFYLLLYRATLPSSGRPQWQKLMEESNPFLLQYGFVPMHSALLYEQVTQMKQLWEQERLLDRLKLKGIFYQFVQELLGQIHENSLPLIQEDYTAQVIRYIEANYTEALTLLDLAELMGSSPRSLSRRFKQATGYSPIDYMLRLRMEKAKELLVSTDATLEEIALGIGYPDGYYFGRMFKKYTGMSPIRFKQKVIRKQLRPYLTSELAGYDIFPKKIGRYISSDNDYHYIRGGTVRMRRSTRSGMALTLLLSLTLLLGACSGGAGDNRVNGGNSGGVSEVNGTKAVQGVVNSTQTPNKTSSPRIISTVMGDIEVPVHPKRVVVDWHLGQVLALGMTPVGASSLNLQYGKFLTPLIKEKIEDIGKSGSISLEKVLELEPDLIITWDQKAYESYSKIAPTVVFQEYPSIQEEMTAMGQILNRQEEAKRWLTEFEQRVEVAQNKIKKVVPENATFTAVNYILGKKVIILGSKAVYKILGLKPDPEVKRDILDPNKPSIDVSWEQASDYVGDYVFIMQNADSPAVELPNVWTTLDAIKNKRFYDLDVTKYFAHDPLSVLLQAEEIASKLTERASGK
ncbi:Iron(3+)-hydroxamate-binding protein YxeB precursor [compost metagenome]